MLFGWYLPILLIRRFGLFFQCLSIIPVATVVLTMITENSLAKMLCIWVLSPSKHSLGDTGKVLPSQLLNYSRIVFQKGCVIFYWVYFPLASLTYFLLLDIISSHSVSVNFYSQQAVGLLFSTNRSTMLLH